jgi:Cu-Zn family superoxide dismutase
MGLMVLMAPAAALAVGPGAAAEIKSPDGKVIGSVDIKGSPSGVLLVVKLEGLPPGSHAIRFHEAGMCEGDFSGAGGIYNPLGAKHGLLSEEGPMAGDLPNVVAGADGKVEAELLTPFVHLATGDDSTIFDEDGAAIVLFEKADDHMTDPDGGAGAPIACGVVAQKK